LPGWPILADFGSAFTIFDPTDDDCAVMFFVMMISIVWPLKRGTSSFDRKLTQDLVLVAFVIRFSREAFAESDNFERRRKWCKDCV
jgi:hypothetical protein